MTRANAVTIGSLLALVTLVSIFQNCSGFSGATPSSVGNFQSSAPSIPPPVSATGVVSPAPAPSPATPPTDPLAPYYGKVISDVITGVCPAGYIRSQAYPSGLGSYCLKMLAPGDTTVVVDVYLFMSPPSGGVVLPPASVLYQQECPTGYVGVYLTGSPDIGTCIKFGSTASAAQAISNLYENRTALNCNLSGADPGVHVVYGGVVSNLDLGVGAAGNPAGPLPYATCVSYGADIAH